MIRDINDAGSFTSSHSTFTQFGFDLQGHIEQDHLPLRALEDGDGSLDSLVHLLGDPYDYMYDIVWESNF